VKAKKKKVKALIIKNTGN